MLSKEIFLPCGTLNLSPHNDDSAAFECYGARSFETLKSLGLPHAKLDHVALASTFPQFNGNLGYFDPSAGVLKAREIRLALVEYLRCRGVTIISNTQVLKLQESTDEVRISCSHAKYSATGLILTCGIWTNEVLSKLGTTVRFPIIPSRPIASMYLIPSEAQRDRFTAPRFPLFALLDYGFYGLPIVDQSNPGVKVGMFHPPGLGTPVRHDISLQKFVNTFLPELKEAKSCEVTDTDQCFYDMTSDENFIIGRLPGNQRVAVATGFCGTGFKFAPLVGRFLRDILLEQKSVLNFDLFDPSRFEM